MATRIKVTDESGRVVFTCRYASQSLALGALVNVMAMYEKCSASIEPCLEIEPGETMGQAAARWEREGRAFD